MNVKIKLIYNAFSNGLQFGIRWLFNVVLARRQHDIYGEFAFLYTMSVLLSSFFLYGANLYNVCIANLDNTKKCLMQSLGISFVFFCLFLFATLVINIFYGYEFLFYMGTLGFLYALNQNLFSYYKGLGKFDIEFKAYILFSIAFFIFIFFIVFNIHVLTMKQILMVLIVLNFIPLVYGFIYLKLPEKIKTIDIESIFNINILKERWNFGFHEILSILFKNLEFVFITLIFSNEILGDYRAIYNIVVPISLIPVIISQVLFSQLTRAHGNINDLINIFMKFIPLTCGIAVLLIVLHVVFSDLIFKILYKNLYTSKENYYLLYIFLANMFIYFVKSNIEVFMTSLGLQKERVKILKICLISFLFLSLLVNIFELNILFYGAIIFFINSLMFVLQMKSIFKRIRI